MANSECRMDGKNGQQQEPRMGADTNGKRQLSAIGD